MKKIDAPNGRFYTDGDHYYPSVTTIIDKILAKGYYFKKWLGNANSFQEAEDYKNEKADKGTKVHEYCERLTAGEEIDVSGDSKEVIKKTQGFIKFYNAKKPTVLDTEFQVVNKLLRYAGTADLMASIDDELWLLDIKTSSNIYNSHKLQLSFYQKAIDSEIDHQGIVWLKDRTKKGYQLKEIDYNPELVTAVFNIYEWMGDMSPMREEKLPKSLKLEDD